MPSAEPTADGVDVAGIRAYLDQTKVRFAILFGSHARGSADESSGVDIALHFPAEMDATERFHCRNRIDATLQEYADGFVDVSDIKSLPNHVAFAALQDGIRLVGDEHAIDRFTQEIASEYETRGRERDRKRREFIERLAETGSTPWTYTSGAL